MPPWSSRWHGLWLGLAQSLAGMLGCFGNDEVRTPHLDALGRRGRKFEQAFCVNAMCSPRQASALTAKSTGATAKRQANISIFA